MKVNISHQGEGVGKSEGLWAVTVNIINEFGGDIPTIASHVSTHLGACR